VGRGAIPAPLFVCGGPWSTRPGRRVLERGGREVAPGGSPMAPGERSTLINLYQRGPFNRWVPIECPLISY
jgi:hypothetical protein